MSSDQGPRLGDGPLPDHRAPPAEAPSTSFTAHTAWETGRCLTTVRPPPRRPAPPSRLTRPHFASDAVLILTLTVFSP